MKTEVVMITPKLAKEWLEYNTYNRTMRVNRVTRLARDMKAGKWELNGESVKFDIKNRLVDGQHRLAAVVESGASVKMLVVTELKEETYSTIDVGLTKVTADFLGPNGFKNSFLVAAAAKLLCMWQNGNLSNLKDGAKLPTTKEILDVVANNPNIEESVSFVVGNKELKRILTPSFSVFLHYTETCLGNYAKVSAFLERLASGLNLNSSDPAWHLRKVLLAHKSSRKKMGQQDILAMLIKCWNYTKKDKKMADLRYRLGEEFPELEG